MIRVGVTGSMGCGKSTVAAMLAALGAETFDADAAVHGLLAPGGAAVEAVTAAFPEARSPAGGVDRARLARVVFADPVRRAELERILHPLVLAEGERRRQAAEERGAPMFVTDAALLFEAARAGHAPDLRTWLDAVVVVTCDPAVQRRRLAERQGGVPEDFEKRLAAQLPQEEKARLASHVIDNSGPVEQTERQVRMVHSALLRDVPPTPT